MLRITTPARMFFGVFFTSLLCIQVNAGEEPPLSFTDVTVAAGFDYQHGYPGASDTAWPLADFPFRIGGGVGAGDFDNDGWIDLYVVGGTLGPNRLFRNRGDGTFEEVGALAGVAVTGEKGSGPAFVDIDADGWQDILVAEAGGTTSHIFKNMGDGTFIDIVAGSGFVQHRNTFSSAFGDYDLDGSLDIAQAHWEDFTSNCTAPCTGHLWQGDGQGNFFDVNTEASIEYVDVDLTFTPNFADINNDGYPDLLFASDLNTSRVFLNDGDGTFTDITDPEVMTDEGGMGAAVGDYDNDGDLDWLITSVFDSPPVGQGVSTGNRLYNNQGDGTFVEVSDAAGVRIGYWGWGACFADANNDGNLDIFHVNGWLAAVAGGDFSADPSRLFIANGDGTFSEQSTELGLIDNGQGRGVVCFDYDRDGDIDFFVANNNQAPKLFRNDGGNNSNFLNVKLTRNEPGKTHIGARIYVTVGATTQMREVSNGNNFVSQNPEEVHFGLDTATVVDQLRIRWPDGLEQIFENIAANQFLVFDASSIFADGFESGNASQWSQSTGL